MALVDWEKHESWVGNDPEPSWAYLEINDQTNACRRLHWHVRPNCTMEISVPALGFNQVIVAGETVEEGDWNIPGNIRLVENTDDPQDPYLEFPHPYTITVRTN